MDAARRLALGQWFTPPEVADLALALALPPASPEALQELRVLDPACGDGVFLARAHARGVGRLHGIEIDEAAAAAARARVPAACIHRGDLFDDAIASGMLPGMLFDAVVGNPPYVRQERLDTATKQRIRQRLIRDWPDVPAAAITRVVGRGDLAAACILRALRQARPGARVALVVSSALLDAAYAAALWQVVARCGRVVALVDAPRERWFDDAAINAMILVLERAGAAARAPAPVQVARLSVPTAEAAHRTRDLASLAHVAEVRQAPADRPERWAASLRASAAWFAFEDRAGAALVPLGTIAEVRRGLTSGANDIFYLPRARAAALGLEPDLLLPLLRSPRGHATIAVDPAVATHVALVCPPEAGALARYPAARDYLDAHRQAAQRPSLRARRVWWSLPVRPARLFLTKAYGARFVQCLAGAPMVADQRAYAIHPADGPADGPAGKPARQIDAPLLAAVLNSTFTAFALESLGRASMGEGALEWTVADAAHLPILDPRRLAAPEAEAARRALLGCAGRAIGNVREERCEADRLRLDRAVAAAAPGALRQLDEVWEALIDSVRRRNERPRGSGRRAGCRTG